MVAEWLQWQYYYFVLVKEGFFDKGTKGKRGARPRGIWEKKVFQVK